jgi:hypothetical protein
MAVTKREAGAAARQATRYGYHHVDATEGYVFCPRCRERVPAYKLAWERWTLPKWTAGFLAHLEDCPERAA